MYQFSQQPQESSQLARLPLAKFSHAATSISHSGPLSWSHIIGNGDIISVFEKRPGATLSTARILLRVSRDCDILEEIDIAYFAREAVAQAQSRQIGHGHPKPIFAVIVKSPCLAVKYPSGGTSVRRFQIKFSSDRDYYTALAILSDIKCPFSESNIGSLQPARKLASSQWNPGLGSSTSGGKDALPSGSGALGISSSNNVIFPSHSSTTCASGMTSTITGIVPSYPS
ncbi:hypothetical protein ASPWEDRAFT_748392 [Aspergillus wentii DTO 134E9]|uniref:Uncharacterized protein n=1 Tax=Aspergillus wentii DTO 134E9 TaxID=1073089 RepID=A0A1L9R6F4_ASPWE|nr:uncharacterized protein ASPWEDRAFT_748392 [Aspergillus wentii DTO 134E9]OJJ30468.1 hypothetical protein ASPWEDRAFT_748392 [Aspergillus wentii DTO 134E9]